MTVEASAFPLLDSELFRAEKGDAVRVHAELRPGAVPAGLEIMGLGLKLSLRQLLPS